MRHALLLMLACAACGAKSNTSNNNTSDNSNDTVNNSNTYSGTSIFGVVESHPLNGPDTSMSNLEVYAQDAITGEPLKTTAGAAAKVTVDASTCTQYGCPFTLPGVDLSQQMYGLQLVTADTRSSGQTWITSATGSAPAAAVTAAVAAKASIGQQTVFALDSAGLTALSDGSGETTTTLLKGVTVGIVIDPNGSGFPGVTVTGGSSVATIVYPNFPDNAQPTPGTATDETGLFVITPQGNTSVTGVPFTLTAPSHTYPTYNLSVYPSEIFFVVYVPTS